MRGYLKLSVALLALCQLTACPGQVGEIATDSGASDDAGSAADADAAHDAGTSADAGVAADAGGGTTADYPFFSPPAYFNRPISYWGNEVDSAATAFMRDFMVNDQRCSNPPQVYLGGFSIYWIHDGDDLKEYSIQVDLTSSQFTCSIPGREPVTKFRIPASVKWSYPSVPGDHDNHLFVIDVDRNLVLSLYAYQDGAMGELATDPSVFRTLGAGCDQLHGRDEELLAAEANRWKAGADWTLPAGGVGGIGTGFNWGYFAPTNAGNSIGGAVMPQDFLTAGDDLGHVLACHMPPDVQSGKTWPAQGINGVYQQPSSSPIRNGSLLRIDPDWTVPAETPAWEARILRTLQRYGCMLDDNGGADGCLGMRGQGTWNGPDGSNPWVGSLPASLLGSEIIDLGLSHFPADRIQVMQPLGPSCDSSYELITPVSPPAFILSHRGRLAVAAGGAATITVTATLGSGPSAAVSFAAGQMPAGLTAAFSPTSCTPTQADACSVTLTVTAGPTAEPGTHAITLAGSTALGQTRSTSLDLAVGSP